MSILVTGYQCACPSMEVRLGLVSRGTVYCNTCEGALGSVEDFYGTRQIEVKQRFSFEEPVTVQILTEDGDLDECNHAGAEAEELEFTAYSTYEGMQVPDDSRYETVMVCDKCEAWQDEEGSWRSE